MGVVITKKLAAKATRRNYIKRKIYAFFEKNKSALAPAELVVVRLGRAIGASEQRKRLSEEIDGELERLTRALGILK